eukprot:6204015-Pleurochrysis_carterae.AAC.9
MAPARIISHPIPSPTTRITFLPPGLHLPGGIASMTPSRRRSCSEFSGTATAEAGHCGHCAQARAKKDYSLKDCHYLKQRFAIGLTTPFQREAEMKQRGVL